MATQGLEGNQNHECEVSFNFNKYKNPEMLNLRTSAANTIINALFMVPGNNPSSPLDGVDIRQYFYQEESAISADKIKADLVRTCGSLPGGALITAVDYSTQQTTENQTVFLLIIKIAFSSEEESVLGVALQQRSANKDIINFNFDYVDIEN